MDHAAAMRLAYEITSDGYGVIGLTRAVVPHDWLVVVDGSNGPFKVRDEQYWQATRRRARRRLEASGLERELALEIEV